MDRLSKQDNGFPNWAIQCFMLLSEGYNLSFLSCMHRVQLPRLTLEKSTLYSIISFCWLRKGQDSGREIASVLWNEQIENRDMHVKLPNTLPLGDMFCFPPIPFFEIAHSTGVMMKGRGIMGLLRGILKGQRSRPSGKWFFSASGLTLNKVPCHGVQQHGSVLK